MRTDTVFYALVLAVSALIVGAVCAAWCAGAWVAEWAEQ